jgi:signal transduction histidine kinase
MAVELAEVAAGLPMAASFALAGGISTLREGRRRTSLNEAMHELRRPLQVLSLALPDRLPDDAAVDSSLRLATAALDRLDRQINGSPIESATASLSPRPLLEEAVLRWKNQASLSGSALRLSWAAGDLLIDADPIELAQAVDNLISNAIEHGGGDITVEARCEGLFLTISVSDSGTARLSNSRPRRRRGGRRGHGLRVVAAFAEVHGGDFRLQPSKGGAEAILRLPLALEEECR